MSQNSAIEWTDATWNPVTGCTKVSPACANCYIDRQTPFRVAGRKFVKGHIPLEFHENRLDAPLRRRTPTRYFVNSMSDLFHEDVPDEFIDRVWGVMARSPQHTFQILTKRARRMKNYFDRVVSDGRALFGPGRYEPRPNVWLGVSVENQHFADQRIPLLLETPAAVRFLSCEPLLGAIDLHLAEGYCRACKRFTPGTITGHCFDPKSPCFAGEMAVADGLDWVIVGGESGPRLRPTDPEWVRSLRDQCTAAGVAFFFKQWGGRTPKSGGRLLDGREWSEFPRVGQ